MGATSVSWAPSVVPGSFTRPTAAAAAGSAPGGVAGAQDKQKRFVTGGCDSKVKVWGYRSVLLVLYIALMFLLSFHEIYGSDSAQHGESLEKKEENKVLIEPLRPQTDH